MTPWPQPHHLNWGRPPWMRANRTAIRQRCLPRVERDSTAACSVCPTPDLPLGHGPGFRRQMLRALVQTRSPRSDQSWPRAGRRIACAPQSAQVIFQPASRARHLERGMAANGSQARLRRRSACRRVLRFARVSRRSSVDRVASISETVFRIPLRRWAVWNQGLIDFMLDNSARRSAVPTPLRSTHSNPATKLKKSVWHSETKGLSELPPNNWILQTLRPALPIVTAILKIRARAGRCRGSRRSPFDTIRSAQMFQIPETN